MRIWPLTVEQMQADVINGNHVTITNEDGMRGDITISVFVPIGIIGFGLIMNYYNLSWGKINHFQAEVNLEDGGNGSPLIGYRNQNYAKNVKNGWYPVPGREYGWL